MINAKKPTPTRESAFKQSEKERNYSASAFLRVLMHLAQT